MPAFYVNCAKGLEHLLARDLEAAGIKGAKQERAGASFEGTLENAYRLCLYSRVANRVLMPIARFAAPDPKKLYAGMKAIKWSDHLDVHGTLAIDVVSVNSEINHTQFAAQKAKDAIVDQFLSVAGARPSVEFETPSIRIHIHLKDNQAQVSLDLSGQSLHRRGYRADGRMAPLKETLASAILLEMGWAERADRGESLVDLMCGSGTFAIEAALIASHTAPGLMREYFGFVGWKQHDAALWKRLRDEARAQVREKPAKGQRMIGWDQDRYAITAAIENARLAGMTAWVHFEKQELGHGTPPAGPGLVLVNPPYGERLGEVEALKPLYRQIGDVFKKQFPGYAGGVLTGSPILAKEVGLRASQRVPVWNGALESRLLKFELYASTRTPQS